MDDIAKFGARRIVPDYRGVNHPRDRPRRPGRLMQRLSEIAPPDDIRETLQKFTDMNCCSVQVEQAFKKNRNGDDAAGQNWPHQQTALLNVVDHETVFLDLFGESRKPNTYQQGAEQLDDWGSFARNALGIKIAEAFCDRANYAVTNLAIIDLNYTGEFAHCAGAKHFIRSVHIDKR
jgi:hypothetical protein